MANLIDVIEALEFLFKANLSYPPKRETIKDTAEVWHAIFRNETGEVIRQAARDWVALEEEFPKPAQFRRLVEKIRANNNQSTAGGMFTSHTQHGWEAWERQAAEDEAASRRMLEGFNPPAFASWEHAAAWQEAIRTGQNVHPDR